MSGLSRLWLVASALFVFASPASAQYFDYDPEDPKEYAPLREGEKAVIPLDTGDPAYNLWQTPRDDLMEGRDPGPINIQRFAGGAGWAGIPTFFKLPIALTPEDLQELFDPATHFRDVDRTFRELGLASRTSANKARKR